MKKAQGIQGIDGWMPIETAPKDGTRFLGWHPEYYESRPRIGIWNGHQFSFGGVKCPTHWHPLPKPPVPTDEQRK